METDKAWLLSCCSACFGVEAKLVATEFEVLRRHAPTMFGPPFVIIQFVGAAFEQTGSPLKAVEDLARTCPLRKAHRGGLI